MRRLFRFFKRWLPIRFELTIVVRHDRPAPRKPVEQIQEDIAKDVAAGLVE